MPARVTNQRSYGRRRGDTHDDEKAVQNWFHHFLPCVGLSLSLPFFTQTCNGRPVCQPTLAGVVNVAPVGPEG
jgi:hypothetical protein